jgi:hypothetical protein
MAALGWSDRETSLFTNATGTSALSYMSHRNLLRFASTTSRFGKSDAFGAETCLGVGSVRT